MFIVQTIRQQTSSGTISWLLMPLRLPQSASMHMTCKSSRVAGRANANNHSTAFPAAVAMVRTSVPVTLQTLCPA